MLTIVFGIHYNLFIVLPILCKFVDLMISSVLQENICALEKSGASERCPSAPDHPLVAPLCFSVNSAKFLRTPLLTEHLRWLLLDYYEQN